MREKMKLTKEDIRLFYPEYLNSPYLTIETNSPKKLRDQILQNQEIVTVLNYKINMMENAEVDVQNWLSEEGHKIHSALLYHFKQILDEAEKNLNGYYDDL